MKKLKKISFKELGQRQIMNTTEMKNILGGGSTGTLSPGGGAIFTCQCSNGANVPYLAQWTAYYHDSSDFLKDITSRCVGGAGKCTNTDPYSL